LLLALDVLSSHFFEELSSEIPLFFKNTKASFCICDLFVIEDVILKLFKQKLKTGSKLYEFLKQINKGVEFQILAARLETEAIIYFYPYYFQTR
jgi:hypothetical protein